MTKVWLPDTLQCIQATQFTLVILHQTGKHPNGKRFFFLLVQSKESFFTKFSVQNLLSKFDEKLYMDSHSL